MLFGLLWLASASAIFILGYSLGHQAGYEDGTRKGFQGALQRAIQVERPLDLLKRVLVPRRES